MAGEPAYARGLGLVGQNFKELLAENDIYINRGWNSVFGECNLFKGNPELCQAQLQDEDVLSEFL